MTADNGDELERKITFMKGYSVFNCEQIDGLPEHYYARPSPPLPAPKRIKGHQRRRAFRLDGADTRLRPKSSFLKT